jgi:uncharacterized iron-regulated membrane protein
MSDTLQSSLYRAVWRWHFYAGLLVLPFLILLAVTGGLYLFKPELDHAIYRQMIEVRPGSDMAPVGEAAANVERALRGRVLQVTLSERDDRSLRFLVRVASGETRTAFADPHDGQFLGSTAYGGVMQLIRKIHSLQQFGFWASSIIEIVAGWAIVLAATGLFLWWPRGRKAGVVTIRGTPRTRTFWRDLHAVTGAFAATIIIFLAVTGMPWSLFWGDHVQKWATAHNLNRPAPPAAVTPAWMLSATMPGMNHAAHTGDELRGEALTQEMPWALQQSEIPSSHAHDAAAPGIGLDGAIARLDALGLPRPFSVQTPESANGAYVGTYTPDRVEQVRTIYLDRHSGAVLGDVGYADYGAAAQAIEWGIAVHQGQQYGPLNRYLMLAGCLSILVLAGSAVAMWWKRRPRGSLGAPPVPEQKGVQIAVLVVMAGVGLVYPLVGVSLAIALALDRIIARTLSQTPVRRYS